MPRALSIVIAGLLTLSLSAPIAAAGPKAQGSSKSQQPAAASHRPAKAQAKSQGKPANKTVQAKPAVATNSSNRAKADKKAEAATHNPPGNNGTIKIDGQPFDTHPNNEPHPGCTFQVDYYGFDEGDLYATNHFKGIAPTGGGHLLTDRVFIGQDPAGGGTDLDAQATYDLSSYLAGVTPHPKQGYHVKLTAHADGSQGADTKHKVSWVESCATTPPITPPGMGGGKLTPVDTTLKYRGMGGGNLAVASMTVAAAPAVQAMGGALPNTGSMLDIFIAALLALGFAAIKKVYDRRQTA